MNNNDMNDMIKKAQSMIQNNQIPDDIKNLINNFQNSNTTSNSQRNNINSNDNKLNSQNNDSKIPDIDIETMMKLQKIMSQMNNSNDDDMSKLLLSLKPYLRDTKKDKLDEYIKLIKMGKMTQLFNSFGGEQK